ncbi:MAG TPA: hypothetical protein VF168_09695 [Trueperaceae bacterium]
MSRSDPSRRVEKPLNLPGLARTGAGAPQSVPGTRFEVSLLETRTSSTLAEGRWLLLLAGELIVDLPHGDFRILAEGDALRLPAGLEVACQPVRPSVLLWAPAD